jgi:hypothetical protein
MQTRRAALLSCIKSPRPSADAPQECRAMPRRLPSLPSKMPTGRAEKLNMQTYAAAKYSRHKCQINAHGASRQPMPAQPSTGDRLQAFSIDPDLSSAGSPHQPPDFIFQFSTYIFVYFLQFTTVTKFLNIPYQFNTNLKIFQIYGKINI